MTRLVAVCVSVTLAPETTAPFWSLIVPSIAPVGCCPFTVKAVKSRNIKQKGLPYTEPYSERPRDYRRAGRPYGYRGKWLELPWGVGLRSGAHLPAVTYSFKYRRSLSRLFLRYSA